VIDFSSKETWRRDPGVPWNAKTGGQLATVR
jgi:hypothetical protein